MIHRIKNSIAASTLTVGLFLAANPEQGVQSPHSSINAWSSIMYNVCKDLNIVSQKPFEYADSVHYKDLLPQGQMFRVEDVPHSNSIRLVVNSRCGHYFDEAQIAFMIHQACMRYLIRNRNSGITDVPSWMSDITMQYKATRDTIDIHKSNRFWCGLIAGFFSVAGLFGVYALDADTRSKVCPRASVISGCMCSAVPMAITSYHAHKKLQQEKITLREMNDKIDAQVEDTITAKYMPDELQRKQFMHNLYEAKIRMAQENKYDNVATAMRERMAKYDAPSSL